MNFIEFINMNLMTAMPSDEPLEQPVNKFVQALKERWNFQVNKKNASMQPEFKNTDANRKALDKMFSQIILKSEEFRDLYIATGATDYREFLALTKKLPEVSDKILIRAFISHNKTMFTLAEFTMNLVSYFYKTKKEPTEQLLFTENEKESIHLCKACFRFFKTTNFRHKYCSIHRNNRRERESNLRKVNSIQSKPSQKFEWTHQDILSMESVLRDIISKYEMHDDSLDPRSLARHVKEKILEEDHTYMIAVDRLVALEQMPVLKPGPNRNYDVGELIQLREKGVKWSELEKKYGRTRQTLSAAISKA